MRPYTTCTGVAAPLIRANLDTDVIMPKQFLKGIDRQGLARGLFYDLRYDAGGAEHTDFVLNQPAYRAASFLVVGPNFGCGSSREHAVWGLLQYGIRAILGTSFASIFHDNCLNNGLLPIVLPIALHARIATLCAHPPRHMLTVDLVSQTITLVDQSRLPFVIDAMHRDNLLHGRDAIASTQRYAADIDAFEEAYWQSSPWLKPVP